MNETEILQRVSHDVQYLPEFVCAAIMKEYQEYRKRYSIPRYERVLLHIAFYSVYEKCYRSGNLVGAFIPYFAESGTFLEHSRKLGIMCDVIRHDTAIFTSPSLDVSGLMDVMQGLSI